MMRYTHGGLIILAGTITILMVLAESAGYIDWIKWWP